MNQTEALELAREIIDEHAKNLREREGVSAEDRAWEVMLLIALMIKEVTENELRMILTMSGIDLDNPSERDASSDAVGLFVKASAIVVHDKYPDTLVDLDSDLAIKYTYNDELYNKLDSIKHDAVFWESFMAPNIIA